MRICWMMRGWVSETRSDTGEGDLGDGLGVAWAYFADVRPIAGELARGG